MSFMMYVDSCVHIKTYLWILQSKKDLVPVTCCGAPCVGEYKILSALLKNVTDS
jgi:hypothetical protein